MNNEVPHIHRAFDSLYRLAGSWQGIFLQNEGKRGIATMDHRTLVKINFSNSALSFRTISHQYCSSHSFIILREQLLELEQKEAHSFITADISSYATLRRTKEVTGKEILTIKISWLSRSGTNELSGRQETVRLPYSPIHEFLLSDGEIEEQTWKVLSIDEHNSPSIEFHSRKNLAAVVKEPLLRHKLGVFLSRHFQWYNYEKIVLKDDYFMPYSFLFTGITPYGVGINGAVILNGRDDISKSSYSIHT